MSCYIIQYVQGFNGIVRFCKSSTAVYALNMILTILRAHVMQYNPYDRKDHLMILSYAALQPDLLSQLCPNAVSRLSPPE